MPEITKGWVFTRMRPTDWSWYLSLGRCYQARMYKAPESLRNDESGCHNAVSNGVRLGLGLGLKNH
jgi:hypothetical protein